MNPLMKAFEGEPKTEITNQNGATVITVSAKHIRPRDARANDDAAILFGFGAVGVAIWIAVAMQGITPEAIMTACAGLFGRPLLQMSYREWGHVTTNLQFTEEFIFIQRAPVWFETPQWEKFDRRSPHRFVVLEHEKAREEKDEIEYRARNNPGKRVARYYTDSYFVVLEYLGQRVDLVEVMGARRARAILERLVLCDEYMNGVVSARQRLPLRPQDEWSGPSSSVPQ